MYLIRGIGIIRDVEAFSVARASGLLGLSGILELLGVLGLLAFSRLHLVPALRDGFRPPCQILCASDVRIAQVCTVTIDAVE